MFACWTINLYHQPQLCAKYRNTQLVFPLLNDLKPLNHTLEMGGFYYM